MYAAAGWRGGLAGAAGLIFCLAAIGATDARADSRHAAFVVDANSGRVLDAANADAQRFPASLTKMMTLYLVFEQIEAGRLDAATPIRISAQAAGVPPSKLDLDPGDTIPLGAAIRALVTKSANDVAVALAEHISGNEAAFARLMTAKARQLGMRATVFRNAHGLPDPEQVTTARDIATLSLALYDHFPQHARIFATRQFSYAGSTYRNHNTMLGSFEGMEGIKTGYTRASGFNLSSSVRRDGRHVVAVVMGGRTAAARNAEMRTLLNRSLARASTSKSRRPVLIARAEPKPTPAVRPMPRQAAAAPQPAPRLVEPIRAAVAPASASYEPPIRMARVRTVPLGQSTAATAPPVPSQPRYQPASVAQPATEEARQFVVPDQGRGARPSTLDAQARRLDVGHPAVYAGQQTGSTTPAAAPQTYTPPSYAGAVSGDFAVQVGAFPSAAEAQARLREVRQSAGSLLAAATDTTEPVAQGSRTLYRARFSGLEAGPAAQTCTALRRQRVECFVTRLR
jgi:D-alanyl-D-alanine carboxypeptidase